jgi:hypothetical protein
MQDLLQGSGSGPAAAAAAVALTGAGAPKSVATIRYGRDGASVATMGQAAYGERKQGGARLSYVSRLAGGAAHASSEVTVDAGGRALSATTELLHPNGTVRKKIIADYSGVMLNAAGRASSGGASFSVSDPDGTPTHSAQMNFEGERFSAYFVEGFAPGSDVVATRTETGFSNALQVGTRLVGGEIDLAHAKGGGVPTTRSRSLLTRHGLPSELHSTNYDADGTTPLRLVVSNYAGIAFDPRGKIDSGRLLVLTRTPAGVEQGGTVFTYKDGKLRSVARLRPDETISPAAVAPLKPVPGPWTPNRPADRCKEIRRLDGSLAERREDWYAAPKIPQRTLATGFATDGRTIVSVTDIDYRGARFDPSGRACGGAIVSTSFEAGTRASTTHINY